MAISSGVFPGRVSIYIFEITTSNSITSNNIGKQFFFVASVV